MRAEITGQHVTLPLAMCGPRIGLGGAGRLSCASLSGVGMWHVNRCARVVLKAGQRRVVTTPFEPGKLQISIVIHFQGDPLERRMPTISFHELSDDVQNGFLHTRVKRIVVGSRSANGPSALTPRAAVGVNQFNPVGIWSAIGQLALESRQG